MLRTGSEVYMDAEVSQLIGRRVGVLCNPSSLVRTASGRRVHLVDALTERGCNVVRLFGPEHGLWSTAQDLIAVEGGQDPVFCREVTTLYGRSFDTLTVQPQALQDIDVLVFDVQDVGSRYYTYFATLCMAIDTCAQLGVEVLVLDRPNPLGGEVIEGGYLPERYRSFVGWLDIPQRHGLTIGEIAKLYVAEAGLSVALRVVSCSGWDAANYLDEQNFGPGGSCWYAPSPNMPTVATAVVYPGGCLIEGTRLSEGRGTTRPFELVGAPYLDARRYAQAIERRNVPGLAVRPMRYEPTFQKFSGLVCGGVAVEVSDRRQFAAVRAGLALIDAAIELAADQFEWRTEVYEFVTDRLAIDLLMGGTHAREVLQARGSLADATHDFASAERDFAERARPSLLYPRKGGRWAGA